MKLYVIHIQTIRVFALNLRQSSIQVRTALDKLTINSTFDYISLGLDGTRDHRCTLGFLQILLFDPERPRAQRFPAEAGTSKEAAAALSANVMSSL